MARGRIRGTARFARQHPILHLAGALLFAVGAYWSRASWQPAHESAPWQATAVHASEALVERVVDGDTLVLSGGDRVRLIGVDTPETKHPGKPPEPFGQEAYEFTRNMVEGRQVQLRFDPRESKDRYGRTLAYVYVDGEFINEALVRAGLARALTHYPFSPEMKELFRSAEASARAERLGIWSLPESAEPGRGPNQRRSLHSLSLE